MIPITKPNRKPFIAVSVPKPPEERRRKTNRECTRITNESASAKPTARQAADERRFTQIRTAEKLNRKSARTFVTVRLSSGHSASSVEPSKPCDLLLKFCAFWACPMPRPFFAPLRDAFPSSFLCFLCLFAAIPFFAFFALFRGYSGSHPICVHALHFVHSVH